MKHFSGVSKIAVLLLMLVLPAVASAPIIVVNPLTPFVLAAGPDSCPFDVYFAPQAGRPNAGKIILFANGSEIIHGATFVTATNLSNSKSLNLNISGPGSLSFSDNTFTALGVSLSFDVPQNLLPANLPLVALTHGQLVEQFDNSGNLLSVSFTGTAQDVCQLLE